MMKLYFRIIDRCGMIDPDIWDSDSPEDQVAKYESHISEYALKVVTTTLYTERPYSKAHQVCIVEQIHKADPDKFDRVEDWPVKVEVFDSEDAKEPIAVAEIHKRFYYEATPISYFEARPPKS